MTTTVETRSVALANRKAVLIVAWLAITLIALSAAAFLHEDAHGVGARLDGIHVSTGFNKVGNPGLAPGDPEFRTGLSGGVWTGLLGPLTSWALAAAFTFWLFRFKQPTLASLIVGAVAVASSLMRALPMAGVLAGALRGLILIEDETQWGIWYIGLLVRPELRPAGALALAQTDPRLLLSYPAIWVAVGLSAAISAIFLILAYIGLLRLWGDTLGRGIARIVFLLIPFAAWWIIWPALNWLDRVIRINWQGPEPVPRYPLGW